MQARPGLIVRRLAGEHEYARADDAADAEAGEGPGAQHSPETVLAFHFLVYETERLALEEMLHRSPTDLPFMIYDLLFTARPGLATS
jgi:hypothetical protein